MRRNNVKVKEVKHDIIITEETDELFFEIGNKITCDIAEAVAILMSVKSKVFIWDLEINKKCQISPEKCLYWLTGGEKEWIHLENYNKNWIDCYSLFVEHFGDIIIKIVNNANTYGDIKEGFMKYINLPTIYEFALTKDIID